MRNVLVDDRPALGVDDVIASARSMLVRGAQVLFVDHLGEIRLNRTDRHDLDIIDVLQQLRGLSKLYRVPVVVLCHLRRRDGLTVQSEPALTDFAFSAGIERMARVALGLSKPAHDTLQVHVLKQTQGISGVNVDLVFDGSSGLVIDSDATDLQQRVRQRYEVDNDNK
jgi:replicative DNA helicase